jgi:hypothetical protein
MAAERYLLTATDAVKHVDVNGAWSTIPNSEENTDWLRYQKWLADGGVPEPYTNVNPAPKPAPPELQEKKPTPAKEFTDD